MSAPAVPTQSNGLPAVFALAADADCCAPDTAQSPGAVWLVRVAESALEAWTWATEHDELAELLEDGSHELADGAVPIYTVDLWRVFMDLGAWQTDTEESGPVEDMTKGAQTALYVIARTLVEALFADWSELDTEDHA